MSKVIIKTSLTSEEKTFYLETKGILKQKEITYYENELLVKIKVLEKGIIIDRLSEEYKVYIPLIKEEIQNGFYELKGHGKIFFEVKVHNLKISNKLIEAEYSIHYSEEESSRFQFKIEYE